MIARALIPVVALAGAAALTACGTGTQTAVLPGASAARGHAVILRIGCGACHTIGGVDGANGRVGPPLTNFKRKRYIAGELPNSPANVVRWIRNPQAVRPQTIMPNLGLREDDIRDVVAYLYGQ